MRKLCQPEINHTVQRCQTKNTHTLTHSDGVMLVGCVLFARVCVFVTRGRRGILSTVVFNFGAVKPLNGRLVGWFFFAVCWCGVAVLALRSLDEIDDKDAVAM